MTIPDRIVIQIIPHSEQRYETVGDYEEQYYYSEEGLQLGKELIIRVSRMSDWRRQALIAIHELAEVYICAANGVKIEDIDAFDMAFEAARAEGNIDEPGDDPKAPYSTEHCIATAIERLMCAQFGISWKEYEDEVNSLYQH